MAPRTLSIRSAENKNIFLQGALGLVAADGVQDSTHSRHGGNASQYNCAHCTALVEDRLDGKVPIDDWNVARTRAQTDCIVQQCHSYIAEHYPDQAVPVSVVEDIRRAFGLSSLAPSWFDAVEYDENRISIIDCDHLFDYGISKQMISHCAAQMTSDDFEVSYVVL